jgi:hypothetical protein
MERDSLYIVEEEVEEDEERVDMTMVAGMVFPTIPTCSPLHLLARSGDARDIYNFLQACDPQGKEQYTTYSNANSYNDTFRRFLKAKTTFYNVFASDIFHNLKEKLSIAVANCFSFVEAYRTPR